MHFKLNQARAQSEWHKTLVEVCVPGGQKLNEFVCLLICLIRRIFKVFQVIWCYKRQISNTACSAAAAAQTGRG